MRLLLVEPYYGGSHRVFLAGLQAHLPFAFSLLCQPAHSWKWRMRFAAPWCAAQLPKKRHVDALLCSTFIDVAVLRGLGPRWLAEVPIFIYFHENQFAYPVQEEQARDVHFALTNYLSAAAADALAFNSHYNLQTFLAGCAEVENKAPDVDLALSPAIAAKARVMPPPLDFQILDELGEPEPNERPVIVWNHRWEHDKNPELFFRVLGQLAQEGLDFGLIVLGQSFRQQPAIFAQAREEFAQRIIHFGYVEDRGHYLRLLRQGSLVLSTARHEFFGLAVVEAVRAGCRPLLPRRLSYPELFPDEFLYDNDKALLPALRQLLRQSPLRLGLVQRRQLTDAFSWPKQTEAYSQWLQGLPAK